MKTRGWVCGALVGVLLAAVAGGAEYPLLPRNAGELRVAVYNNGEEYATCGGQQILAALTGAAGVKAEAIDTLAGETLKGYDVVIISGARKLSAKDASNADLGIQGPDCVKSLVHFVDCGGGVILGYDSIGEYGPFGPNGVFPMIGRAYRRSSATPDHTVKAPDHPVMIGVPAKFSRDSNHNKIVPGKTGRILAVDETGVPSVAVGDIFRGRVVQVGFAMGRSWQQSRPLSEVEKTLLLNAVKWAGAEPKYDVPMKDTEAGLLAQVKDYARQDEADQIAKYQKLPAPRFDESVMWLNYVIGENVRLNTRETIAAMLENCRRMGFTKVCIIAKADKLYYPSKYQPDESRVDFHDDFTPTGAMVEEARKRNLKLLIDVMPFASRRAWKDTNFPHDISLQEYQKMQAGKLMLKDIEAAWLKSGKGANCPDHPEVRAMALKYTEELITMYHPEEISLDYIRYKDGYDTSCYCEYSQARKAEFAAKHPEIAKKDVDKKFAEESLVSFVTEWNQFCKKLDPKIKTSLYTISSPNSKAPDWVNRYPVDWHQKYVSREMSGPESMLDDTAALMQFYHDWIESAHNGAQFAPLIAIYNRKTYDRLLCEFKIVSDLQNKQNMNFKRVEFYEYARLFGGGDPSAHRVNDEMARAISDALGGDTWGKQKDSP